MGLEKELERYLMRRTKDLGGLCLKLLSDLENGLPDRLLIAPGGRVVFVEMKRKGGRVSAIQQWQHTRLRQVGCRVEVLWTKDDIDALMEELYDL